MLTMGDVLFYIKSRLALGDGFLEKNDAQLKDYAINTTLPLFSKFCPDWSVAGIDPLDPAFRGKGKYYNYFKIIDEENLTIICPTNYYFSDNNMFITGHPLFGPFTTQGDLASWALQCFNANLLAPYSNWSYSVKFQPPNLIRVIGSGSGGIATGTALNTPTAPFAVEYERYQSPSLNHIPAEYERSFLDLCLADCMIWIGQIRSFYGDGTVTTQFGDIPLRGQEMMTKGEELKDKIVQELTEQTLPGVFIDFA